MPNRLVDALNLGPIQFVGALAALVPASVLYRNTELWPPTILVLSLIITGGLLLLLRASDAPLRRLAEIGPPDRRTAILAGSILMAGLLVRILWVLWYPVHPVSDEAVYWELATNLRDPARPNLDEGMPSRSQRRRWLPAVPVRRRDWPYCPWCLNHGPGCSGLRTSLDQNWQ